MKKDEKSNTSKASALTFIHKLRLKLTRFASMSQAWLKSKRARCQEIIYGRCYLHGLLSNIPVMVTDWAACAAHKTHHTLPMHPPPAARMRTP